MTRAGLPAEASDLIDVDELINAYYDRVPDPSVPEQRVAFGTSGHRGSSLSSSFNEVHILATTQAIVDYRNAQGIHGPLFLGRDTHGLSLPAERSAIEVLIANGVDVRVDSRDSWVPTPALSHAILAYNKGRDAADPGRADGIVVTPRTIRRATAASSTTRRTADPADTDATGWIADRANELIAAGLDGVAAHSVQGPRRRHARRVRLPRRVRARPREHHRRRCHPQRRRAHRRRPAGRGIRRVLGLIAEVHGLDLTVVNPDVDPTWRFMTLDWDEKIRMDPSSPSAMASLVGAARRVRHPDRQRRRRRPPRHRHARCRADESRTTTSRSRSTTCTRIGRSGPRMPRSARRSSSSMIIDRVGRVARPRRCSRCRSDSSGSCPACWTARSAFGGEESAGRIVPAHGRHGVDDRQGRHPAVPAGRRDPRGDRARRRRSATPSSRPSSAHRPTSASTPRRPPPRRPRSASSRRRRSPRPTSPASRSPRSCRTRPATAPRSAASRCRPSTRGSPRARSGTEDVYKLYAESLRGPEHLAQVQAEAREVVSEALAGA